jgi:hypothetical protein
MKSRNTIKSKWVILAGAFILGALLVFGIRFATYKPADEVHYHANFAIFINGKKEEFKDSFYYKEIALTCNSSNGLTPDKRVHMHDNINNLVHVHAEAVTWGNFFQNIGWVVDPRLIRSISTLYIPDGQNNITFLLNGKKVDGAIRNVIGDEDKLLIDFGNTSDENLQKEFNSIPSTAHKYDITPDPASCSGSKKAATLHDRFVHMF